MEFTSKELVDAFHNWRDLDRSAPALNIPQHFAKVEQAWKQYCYIRDMLTVDKDQNLVYKNKRGVRIH